MQAFEQSFGQALRNELKDTGVSVTTLLPSPADTELFERAELMDTKVWTSDKDGPGHLRRSWVSTARLSDVPTHGCVGP